MSLLDEARMDKSFFQVAKLTDPSDEPEFWRSKTPEERLVALELMRQMAYGYNPDTTRLRHVLEIAERA